MPLRVRLQVLLGFLKILATLPWWAFRSRRRRAQLDEGGEHVIVVGPGPGGRPRGCVSFDPVVVDRIGGEEAYRYRLALGRTDVIEWKFAHGGWLYVVGAVNRCDDEVATLERAREVLDSWEWLH
jgi:hypothetical protein